jgi:hypothetical protein
MEWNKEMLNDAYAALLYADKMGAYTQVELFLGKIEAAQRNGMNIDDNLYGVNQEARDAIKARLQAWQKKNSENQEVKIEIAN